MTESNVVPFPGRKQPIKRIATEKQSDLETLAKFCANGNNKVLDEVFESYDERVENLDPKTLHRLNRDFYANLERATENSINLAVDEFDLPYHEVIKVFNRWRHYREENEAVADALDKDGDEWVAEQLAEVQQEDDERMRKARQRGNEIMREIKRSSAATPLANRPPSPFDEVFADRSQNVGFLDYVLYLFR